MSRVEDITRALSDSFQEYDESLRRRLGDLRDGQTDTSDHLIDVNDDHQVTPEDAGLGHIENYPIATTFVIDEQTDPNQYVDLQGAIHYIRTNLNLGQIVDPGDPISPIGGMDVNNLRPKLRGGAYFNAYDIARKHRLYQLVLATGDFDAPLLDVVVTTGDDLVLGSDLSNLTEYRWRYKDVAVDDVEGPWKEAEFRAAYEIVLTPTLTVDGGTDSTSLSPVFVGSPFTVNTGTDTHKASIWTLYDALGNVLETYTKTTGDLTTWTPSTLLEIVTDYRAEVYYTADNYEQSGVAEVTFTTTDGIIEVPTVAVPSTPTGPFNITLAWNGTDPVNLDAHTSSSLQISRNSSFTDIVVDVVETVSDKTSIYVDNLADMTTYYVRAKLHGDTLGASAWSPTKTLTTGVFEGTTTGITDPNGDFELTAGTGSGENSVLGGRSTQSPAQPIVLYRTPQGVSWAKRLTDIVSEGHITSVIVQGSYIYVTGVQEDLSKSFVASLNLSGDVRWCKEFTGGTIFTLNDLVYGDKLYAVGYSDGHNGSGQMGISGIVLAMSTSGAHQWSRTIGGDGEDRFHGVGYYGGYVVAVGDQSSDFGTTVTATKVASVVSMNVSGVKQWERYWGIGNSSSFKDVLVDSGYVRAVGYTDNNPLISTFSRTNGNPYSQRVISNSTGSFSSITADASSLFVSGDSPNGAMITRHTKSSSPGLVWGVKDNQTTGEAFGILTTNGPELVSRFTKPGRVTSVLSRIPINGSVGDPPYLVGYSWLGWNPSISNHSYTEAQIYGSWSSWSNIDLARTRNHNSSSTPPQTNANDISFAESNGFLTNNTTTVQHRNLSFHSPQYYSNQGSYWEDFGSLSSHNYTSSYDRGQSPNLSFVVPADTSTRRYVYSHSTFTGIEKVWDWGGWWDSEWVDSTGYTDFNSAKGAAMGQEWVILQNANQNPNSEVRNIITKGIKYPNNDLWYGFLEYQQRAMIHKSSNYKYRVYWQQKILKTYTNTGYRWTLGYQRRTRSLTAVSLYLANQMVGSLTVIPTPTSTLLELQHSNF